MPWNKRMVIAAQLGERMKKPHTALYMNYSSIKKAQVTFVRKACCHLLDWPTAVS